MLRYLEFCEIAEKEVVLNGYRKGQVYYNTLQEMYPELANKIVGTYLDPYYDDRILPDFCTWVYNELREEC